MTVTTQNVSSLGAAANTTLTLTPYTDATTVAAVSAIPTQIFKFKCAPGSLPPKYLPGSCR